MKKNILFVGGIFQEDVMIRSKAISPAANRWQKGLLQGLKNNQISIDLLSHFPEPIWPKGKFFPGRKDDFDNRFNSFFVPYWNVPFLRNRSLCNSYKNTFREYCYNNGEPSLICSYNLSEYVIEVGLYAQNHFKIPWVSICADYFNPGLEGPKFPDRAKQAKGHIFLSYKAFKDCNFQKRYHLDGGIDQLKFNPSETSSNHKKYILYTGMLSKWGGISLLLNAFKKIKDPNVQLWVCGYGRSLELHKALKIDSRITFFGLVPENKLIDLCKKTSIFVNPRPNNIPGNDMNFPSKLLEYLSYGKPVLSTWTPGISDDYREIIEVFDQETPECLANSLLNILSWSNQDIYKKQIKIKKFLIKNKTWNIQSANLINWLDDNKLFN